MHLLVKGNFDVIKMHGTMKIKVHLFRRAGRQSQEGETQTDIGKTTHVYCDCEAGSIKI